MKAGLDFFSLSSLFPLFTSLILLTVASSSPASTSSRSSGAEEEKFNLEN